MDRCKEAGGAIATTSSTTSLGTLLPAFYKPSTSLLLSSISILETKEPRMYIETRSKMEPECDESPERSLLDVWANFLTDDHNSHDHITSRKSQNWSSRSLAVDDTISVDWLKKEEIRCVHMWPGPAWPSSVGQFNDLCVGWNGVFTFQAGFSEIAFAIKGYRTFWVDQGRYENS